jgi:hypothetical protein
MKRPLLPGRQGLCEVSTLGCLVEQTQMDHERDQQQARTEPAWRGQQQHAQNQRRHDADLHWQAQPSPGVLGAVAQRGRQGGGSHPGRKHRRQQDGPARDRARDQESQQAGHQRAQHDAQQFDAWHQRLELELTHRHPVDERGVEEPFRDRCLEPFEHLAQPESDRCRKQQGQWPQRQQHQRAARLLDEPVGAGPVPVRHGTEALERCCEHGARQGAGAVQPEVDIGGNARGQVTLQGLHGESDRGACRRRAQHRARYADARPGPQYRDPRQETEGHITRDVDPEVEAGPVLGPRRRQIGPRRDALVAPVGERIKTRVDDQRGVGERKGQCRGLVRGSHLAQKGLTTTSTTIPSSSSTGTSLNQRYQRSPRRSAPETNLRSSTPQAW